MVSLIPSLWGRPDNPMLSLQREMDRLFQDFPEKAGSGGAFPAGFPAMDVHETDAGLEITAELPGVAEEDVDVFLTDRTLTIKGEKKASKTVSEKDRQISERSYGSFRRVMALPYVPEHGQIEAHMENGVLTVVVPRPDEASASPRKIELRKKG